MASQKIDRQTTTPFLLRLFYKHSSFHRTDDFDPTGRLPPHLQIYTWQSCSLRELSTLLLTTLPNLLPKPYAGTRIAFRLVYGDTQAPTRPGVPGRFVSRDLGSVVVGAPAAGDEEMADADEEVGAAGVTEALKQLDGEPEKTLGDAKFVIGDYVSCTVLPPLADGSVQSAPPPLHTGPSRGPPPRDTFGGGRGRDYANGFSGRGDFGYGRGDGRGGRGGRFEDRRGSGGVPSGEWRRGEAPPDRERERGFDRGFDRERDPGPGFWRGGGGGRGGGRGRGRW